MIHLGQIRRSPRLIRTVFGIFALAWLQMAAVPCVMAGTMQDASLTSLNAKVGMTEAEMGHESSGMAMPDAADGQHDCIYCPLSMDSGQTISSANCVFPDQPQADGGGHAPSGHWVLPTTPDLHSFDPASQRHPLQTRSYAAPPRPRPLNLTYCVQLK